jgi:hypothetical protein
MEENNVFTLGKLLKAIDDGKKQLGITDDCEVYLSCDGVLLIYKDDKEFVIDTEQDIVGSCLKGSYLQDTFGL